MNKKGLIIGIASAAVVLVGAAVAAFLLLSGNKEESFRVIKVMSVEGVAQVSRENTGVLDAYEGMALQSGDLVHLEGNSKMVLTLDDDKYAFVEENTDFALYASGSASNSKTAFDVQTGAVTCQCINKLSDDSEYYINTPNSTMAIRGTVVRVSVTEVVDADYSLNEFNVLASEVKVVEDAKRDSITVTRMSTIEGVAKVVTHPTTPTWNFESPDERLKKDIEKMLKEANGYFENSAQTKQLDAGNETLVAGKNDGSSIFLADLTLDMRTLPEATLQNITIAMENAPEKEFPIKKSDVEAMLKDSEHTVIFMYNGKKFGEQIVKDGDKVSVPSLSPAASGGWATDFNTPVTEDAVINWN